MMNRPTRLSVLAAPLAVAAAVFLAPPQAQAGLIVNGGFETGDFTGWTTGPNSYTQFIAHSPVHSGNFSASIAGYSFFPDTLSQTVATAPGQAYDLSFWRLVGGQGRPTTLFEVYWDGVQVFSERNPGAGPFQRFSVGVVGTGSDTVLFRAGNDPDFTYLDDVALTPRVASVPEPSTLAPGALSGLAVLGYAWRRRRAALAGRPDGGVH
jgi:hypothetical protein